MNEFQTVGPFLKKKWWQYHKFFQKKH